MSWGDTFGLGLGVKADKHLIIWTPKETSEGDILPGFDSEDGELTVKMRPRPGAWVSWIDEAKVSADARDDYDRVHRSIQELERNARQITDFADGVVTDITIQNLGKSLTLSELTQEVLKARLAVPSTVKTGSYVLARVDEPATQEVPAATVIIPEQTHIHRVHLNEDVLFTQLLNNDYNRLLVVIRTHIKQYPDLTDLGHSLALLTRLSKTVTAEGEKPTGATEAISPVQVLATAAVYNPLEPETLQLVPIAFDAPVDEIEAAITEGAKKIEAYTVKANQHAYQLMAQFQQGVETRLRALVLGPGQRVHNKVWDDLVIRELRNTVLDFVEFYETCLTEYFGEDIAATKKEMLTQNIDPMIEFWQLQDNPQLTLNHLIQSCYKLANQVLDRATGLFHDLVFEQDFIETGLVKQVDFLIFENNELLDEVYLPKWTRGTVREKIAGVALRSTLHASQIERLGTIWLELLGLANFVSQRKQDFEVVIQPLVDLLLATKTTGQTQRRSQQAQQRRSAANFAGFEIPDDDFEQLLNHVKLHLPTIKQWLEHLPPKVDQRQHYATLWTLLLDGKLRERLLTDTQPTCDINLSVPDQTKRLITLMLGSTLIIQAEKDRKSIERNLNRAIISKTGHELTNVTTPAMLAIHGDALLAILYEELLGYHDTLAKRMNRLSNAPQKRKKRRHQQARNGSPADIEAVEAEQEKVKELMIYLRPYRQEEVIGVLAMAGLDPIASNLEEIRRQQVLSFDVSDLPAIGETWLSESKDIADYPNLRMFLLQNQLPISTTGRLLMELRQQFPDELFNHVIGLIQEVKVLQSGDYQGESLNRFVSYLSEKVWRWELTQITEAELPLLLKEKVLASAICYEKEVETLMEYVERYDELISTKLAADPDLDGHRQYLEEQFQAIVETLLV